MPYAHTVGITSIPCMLKLHIIDEKIEKRITETEFLR